MTNLVGQTVGPYQILEIIHAGDNTVYKGFQPSTSSYVAVKVLNPAQSADPVFAQQFQQDMQAITRLQHPNLLPLLDYGQQDGLFYQVSPLVEGGTLESRLAQYSPLPQAQAMIAAIVSALEYLHSQGMTHGNLKPTNVLLNPQGQPQLTDFGYTQGIDVRGQENAYLSPEQTQGGMVDRRTDVYALGVLLYHMLTGETPAPGIAPNPRLKRPDLPVEVEGIILTAMAQYPDQRYASARDFNNALVAVARPQPAPVPVAPPPAVQAAPQPKKKSTSPVIWIGAIIVLILLLACGFFLFSGFLFGSRDDQAAPAPTAPAEQPPAEEQAPVAVIQAPDQAEVGEGVKFDASASQSSSRIVSYAWEFGDGEGANAVSVRHTYRSPGVYNVILTIIDSNDLSGTSNFQINIVESSMERPTEEPPVEEPPAEEPPAEEPPPAEENQ
jgi:serine/threonine protein kinase